MSSTTTALLDEAKRVAAQFLYTTENVKRGVAEYMKEMEEGLAKEHTTLNQIPTFVTAVPDGTEKVFSFYLFISFPQLD